MFAWYLDKYLETTLIKILTWGVYLKNEDEECLKLFAHTWKLYVKTFIGNIEELSFKVLIGRE